MNKKSSLKNIVSGFLIVVALLLAAAITNSITGTSSSYNLSLATIGTIGSNGSSTNYDVDFSMNAIPGSNKAASDSYSIILINEPKVNKSFYNVSYSKFDGSTTSFNTVDNINSVPTAVLEKSNYGKIRWENNIDAAGADFDSNVDLTYGSIYVNINNLDSSIDSSANLTMYNLSMGYPALYKDNEPCAGNCTIISWDGDRGTVIFNVSSFSNYTASEANQSKINNTGNINVSIYLLLKIQYNNTNEWVDDTVVYDGTEKIRINTTSLLKLDQYFNDKLNISNLSNGYGTYRVYAAATDESNVVLKNIYGNNILATFEFNYSSPNTAPSLTGINYTPSSPNSSDNLTFNTTVTDSDGGDSLTVYCEWYNNSVYFATDTFSSLSTGTVVNCTLTSANTTKNQNWSVNMTAYDETVNSTLVASDVVTIGNALPPKVTLLSPTEGNTTIHNRTPLFRWQNSTDPDGDVVTYNISITNDVAPDVSNTSYVGLNFTHNEDLWTNTETSGNLYYWKVAACDPTQCGEWSDTWNFSIEPYISLSMVNNSIDFGNKNIGDKDNTTDGSPGPFVVQNDGNVIANITWVSANQSMWSTKGLNTEYFRFKVDNTTNEPDSFNYSASTITWTNITDIGVKNETAVAYLHYNDSKDTAEIDLLIEVPADEPPGMKLVTVYVIGQDAS